MSATGPGLPRKVRGYRKVVINALIDYAERITPLPTPSIMRQFGPHGVRLAVSPYLVSGFPWDKLCFGFKLAGDTATILPGWVLHGAKTPLAVAETNVTIAQDYSYVYVEYDGTTASIPALSTTMPMSDANYFRVWFYRFRLVSGAAMLDLIGHMGNVEIPGIWGNL